MINVADELKKIGFKQICNSKEETIDFIHNIKHKDHCVLIFHKDDTRDEIVKEFLNKDYIKNSMTACFTNNPTKYECNHQMTYDSLIQEQRLQPHKISDFLLNVLSDSYDKEQTRIACEETSWLAEHGVFDEHQKWGNTIDKNVIDESSIMCCYNITKLTDEQIKAVISVKKYIILDNPFSVFEQENF